MNRLEDLLNRLNDTSQSVSSILTEFITFCQLESINIKDQILFESTGYQSVSQEKIPEYRLIPYASILVNFNTGFRVGKGISILEVFPQSKLQEMLMNADIVLSYHWLI